MSDNRDTKWSDELVANKKEFVDKWLKENATLPSTESKDPDEFDPTRRPKKSRQVSEPQPFIDPYEMIEADKAFQDFLQFVPANLTMEEFDKVGHFHYADDRPVGPTCCEETIKRGPDRLKFSMSRDGFPKGFKQRAEHRIPLRDLEAGLPPEEKFWPPLYPFGKHFYENTKPGGSFSVYEFFEKHDPRAQKK